jgi:hypothetical protein
MKITRTISLEDKEQREKKERPGNEIKIIVRYELGQRRDCMVIEKTVFNGNPIQKMVEEMNNCAGEECEL